MTRNMFLYTDVLYNLHWAAVAHILNSGVCVHVILLVSAINLQITSYFIDVSAFEFKTCASAVFYVFGLKIQAEFCMRIVKYIFSESYKGQKNPLCLGRSGGTRQWGLSRIRYSHCSFYHSKIR